MRAMKAPRPLPNRRHALCCGTALAAGLFTGLLARAATTTPAQALVQQAFEGLDASRLVDTHAHLLGTGDAGSGCTVHPSLQQWWHPLESLRRRVILDAAGVAPDAWPVDTAYVQRLQALAADFPAGARWWLFAFEQAHDDAGRARPEWSTFHVPDAWAAAVAAASPARFDWVASIHPYREDALTALERAHRLGAVAVKWLPSAMNIDLVDARSQAFCQRLAALGLPLVVHCGEERAVPGAGRDAFGNPLAVRHALAAGATVIVAHCASLGAAEDGDRRSCPRVPAFELFARLMDAPLPGGRLLGDVSAAFQSNRGAEVGRTLLARDDWHGRLLHGSDHPLPGVGPLFSPRQLARRGWLDEAAVAPLQALRAHNPLLFDFVLKRQLRWQGRGLAAGVFEGQALAATVGGRPHA